MPITPEQVANADDALAELVQARQMAQSTEDPKATLASLSASLATAVPLLEPVMGELRRTTDPNHFDENTRIVGALLTHTNGLLLGAAQDAGTLQAVVNELASVLAGVTQAMPEVMARYVPSLNPSRYVVRDVNAPPSRSEIERLGAMATNLRDLAIRAQNAHVTVARMRATLAAWERSRMLLLPLPPQDTAAVLGTTSPVRLAPTL